MSAAENLDQFRNSLPGCSLVVFGDLFSQITLCASTRQKYPQEQLDAICVTAGNLLDGPVANKVATILGRPGSNLARAVILSPEDTQVFLRSPDEDADVLCCMGPLDLEVGKATTLARTTFDDLSSP